MAPAGQVRHCGLLTASRLELLALISPQRLCEKIAKEKSGIVISTVMNKSCKYKVKNIPGASIKSGQRSISMTHNICLPTLPTRNRE